MKEECVCSTGGSGMNRTVSYVTAAFGFLMNLSSCSLATELLLLAGGVQHTHTHTGALYLYLCEYAY